MIDSRLQQRHYLHKVAELLNVLPYPFWHDGAPGRYPAATQWFAIQSWNSTRGQETARLYCLDLSTADISTSPCLCCTQLTIHTTTSIWIPSHGDIYWAVNKQPYVLYKFVCTFRYHVSCTDGKIQLELFIFITYFSTVVPLTSCVFFPVGLSLL